MEKSQWYIGTPNGVVLCVEEIAAGRMKGYFYHNYEEDGVAFSGIDDLLLKLEQFYDMLQFPHPTTNSRSFQEKQVRKNQSQEKVKIMNDDNLLSKHGDLGTFIIRVQHRQNNSWQGRITWMEKNKTIYFRSIWEMIKLIASALDTVSVQEGEEKEQSWDDEPGRD